LGWAITVLSFSGWAFAVNIDNSSEIAMNSSLLVMSVFKPIRAYEVLKT
jgi:hypothetical protein